MWVTTDRRRAAGLKIALAVGAFVSIVGWAYPVLSFAGRESSWSHVRAKAESGIVRCANKNRTRRGIAPLRVEGLLGRAARLHARNEVRWGFFDHVDPLGRGPGERVQLFDPRSWGIGENLVMGATSSSSGCHLWMSSPGHRANILDPAYTHIGAGFAGGRHGNPTHYVQVFGVLYDEEGF